MTGPDTYIDPLWQNHQAFQSLNLHLLEGEGESKNPCRGLWDLLTPRHREDPDCCHGRGQALAPGIMLFGPLRAVEGPRDRFAGRGSSPRLQT